MYIQVSFNPKKDKQKRILIRTAEHTSHSKALHCVYVTANGPVNHQHK